VLPTTGLAAARDPETVRVAMQKVLDALWTQGAPAVMWGGISCLINGDFLRGVPLDFAQKGRVGHLIPKIFQKVTYGPVII
jgi:hypothetical protein